MSNRELPGVDARHVNALLAALQEQRDHAMNKLVHASADITLLRDERDALQAELESLKEAGTQTPSAGARLGGRARVRVNSTGRAPRGADVTPVRDARGCNDQRGRNPRSREPRTK